MQRMGSWHSCSRAYSSTARRVSQGLRHSLMNSNCPYLSDTREAYRRRWFALVLVPSFRPSWSTIVHLMLMLDRGGGKGSLL